MDMKEEISKARFIATEPINFLILAIQGILSTLRTLYIQETLASDYEYDFVLQQGGNCSLPNVSDALEVKINSETALWVMWLASISTFLPILTGPVLVASSDFIGRKPILLFAAAGHFIASLTYLLVSVFQLPLAVTILAAVTLGICGDTVAACTVCTAYIADSTSGHSRTQRMFIQSLAVYAGWGGGQALGGVLLKYLDNFPVSFAVSVALSVLNLAYIGCPGVLLETISPREKFSAKTVLRKGFKNFQGIISRRKSEGRWRVWCLIAIASILFLVNESLYDVIVIYGLGSPFCWTPDVVGYYSAAVSLFPAAVSALIVKQLLKCFSKYWLIHFSLFSFIAQIVTSALAQNTVQLAIVATVVSFLRTSTAPFCRDLISQEVTKREHGMTFALLSLATSVMSVCSPLLINGLFAYTIKIGLPQITFYVTSVLLLIPLSLNGILQYNQRPSKGNMTTSPELDQPEGLQDRTSSLVPGEDEKELSTGSNLNQI